jgi:hypothetical protein
MDARCSGKLPCVLTVTSPSVHAKCVQYEKTLGIKSCFKSSLSKEVSPIEHYGKSPFREIQMFIFMLTSNPIFFFSMFKT